MEGEVIDLLGEGDAGPVARCHFLSGEKLDYRSGGGWVLAEVLEDSGRELHLAVRSGPVYKRTSLWVPKDSTSVAWQGTYTGVASPAEGRGGAGRSSSPEGAAVVDLATDEFGAQSPSPNRPYNDRLCMRLFASAACASRVCGRRRASGPRSTPANATGKRSREPSRDSPLLLCACQHSPPYAAAARR
jgi:hypothetical protein